MLRFNAAQVISALQLWRARRMQALLSMLGVIAGVSGLVLVIALGEGANQELDAALGSLGAGSVIVRDVSESHRALQSEVTESISRLLGPTLQRHAALKSQQVSAQSGSVQIDNVNLLGVDRNYYPLYKLQLHAGRFITAHDLVQRKQVCVLGWETAKALFPRGQVIGQQVRINQHWCQVVGQLANVSYRMPKLENVGISDIDRVIYTPLTVLSGKTRHYYLDELVLQFSSEAHLSAVMDTLKRIILRDANAADFEFIVPIELLRQKQKLQQIFQYLLLGVAAIMLVVGGTGIMNTMLLNVISRRPEIGLRRAIGATREDIISQFVTESLVIAVIGGVLGVAAGFLLSAIIDSVTAWPMSYNGTGATIGFLVSLAVGVIFGSYPAMQAATVSPVRSLNEL